jgi:hypothetical protein
VVTQAAFVRSVPTLNAVVTQIRFRLTAPTMTFFHDQPDELSENENDFASLGSTGGITEVTKILRADTDRSRNWLSELTQQTIQRGYRPVDARAFRLKRALETAILTGVDPGGCPDGC